MNRVFGLIGYPLTHSFSQKYFSEKFLKENIDNTVYQNFSLQNIEDFKVLLSKEKNLCGINVTIPYKEKIIPFLDELQEDAKAIGAVNCIQFSNGKLIGHNTDYKGFLKSIAPYLKNNTAEALILGSGGSSKAIQYALKTMGKKFVIATTNQNILASTLNTVDYSRLLNDKAFFTSFDLIINTTPLGMYPNIDDCPQLPYPWINKTQVLFDVIYNPEKTMFLQKGEAQGATIINGFEMLIIQAEESWKIWNSYNK
jgi:shikimate dehydrogenase